MVIKISIIFEVKKILRNIGRTMSGMTAVGETAVRKKDPDYYKQFGIKTK